MFDVFEKGNPARTDVRNQLIMQSEWFRIPYPGSYKFNNVCFVITIS